VGWYLRKGLSFGPLRINLSKSGLGGSVGVKGFRVGTGPRGRYLHAGRGGLYYRTSLSEPEASESRTDPIDEERKVQTEQLREAGTAPSASPAPQPAAVPGKNQFGVRMLRSILGFMRR
jgi:hypothetical protein